jgi:peptide/nickel transport system substrate-binding protein
MAEHLRDQLRAVGIVVDVALVSAPEWLRRVVGTRDFDLAIFGGTQGPDPDVLRTRLGRSSFIGYSDPSFDAAVEEGAHALDAESRARAYFRAQEALARDQPVVPLAEAVRVSVYGRRVTGLPQVEARGLVAPNDFSLVRLQRPQ